MECGGEIPQTEDMFNLHIYTQSDQHNKKFVAAWSHAQPAKGFVWHSLDFRSNKSTESYLLTSHTCLDNLEFDIFDAGGL